MSNTEEKKCAFCDGLGYTVETRGEHGCDGTEEDCSGTCPVPVAVQVKCEHCGGEGFIY